MRLSLAILAATALYTSPTLGQLNQLAQQAGLLYFGTGTDTPYQRERAPYPHSYRQYDALLDFPADFGQLTPTNGMKWLFTQPTPQLFNFTEGDFAADLARRTGKLLRCHALVWHSQLAPWVDSPAANWTAASLSEAIERHIHAVVGYYRGRCYAWDVVNEVLDEDGTFRKSVFYEVLGEKYIPLAFRAAAEADPGAKLYYNDYGIETLGSNKTAGALRLVRSLREAGVPIHGVGLQAHLHADSHPTAEQLVETGRAFTELVGEVAFTELDVRIALPVNETKLAWQADCYQKVVTACVEIGKCVGITVWDFYDPFSWVQATFPGQGAPLLWFEDFTKHPAYDGMVQTFKQLIAKKGGTSCKRKPKA